MDESNPPDAGCISPLYSRLRQDQEIVVNFTGKRYKGDENTLGRNEKRHGSTTNPSDDIKITLMNKYKEMFIDKLTEQDLRELQFYLKNQFDENRKINPGYKLKFESRLRQYFHEEVMRREIVSIETLLGLLEPGDVEKPE